VLLLLLLLLLVDVDAVVVVVVADLWLHGAQKLPCHVVDGDIL